LTVEVEGRGVVIKEVDKAIDDNVAWPCGAVQRAIHNDVFLCLKFGLAAGAAEG